MAETDVLIKAGIGVVILAVVLGVLASILSSTKANYLTTEIVSVGNLSTGAYANQTAFTLTGYDTVNVGSSYVRNSSINISNQTTYLGHTQFNFMAPNQVNISGHLQSGATSVWNITYDYDREVKTAAVNSSVQGLSGINQYGTWIPIIAIVIVTSVVVGLVLAFRRKEE